MAAHDIQAPAARLQMLAFVSMQATLQRLANVRFCQVLSGFVRLN